MIGSRNRAPNGSWEGSAQQRTFEPLHDRRPGRLLLPPDDENSVGAFRREPASLISPTGYTGRYQLAFTMIVFSGSLSNSACVFSDGLNEDGSVVIHRSSYAPRRCVQTT